MEDKYDLIYNVPHKLCRCRDDENRLRLIARNYKYFYDELMTGKEGIEILNDWGVLRMCCRERFLVIPIEHMINRSENRYFNDSGSEIITKNTRELKPGIEPPNFPILPNL
jgi:DNA-directed RNA polymerase subunit N (RpoN/RPB10)